MSVKQNINGTLVNIAGNGIQNTFTGTSAEVAAAVQAGIIKNGMVVYITDDTEAITASSVSYDDGTQQGSDVQTEIDDIKSDLSKKLEKTFTSTDYSLVTVGSNLKIVLPFGNITPIDVELKYSADFAYNNISNLLYESDGTSLSLIVYNSSTWSGNITVRYRKA